MEKWYINDDWSFTPEVTQDFISGRTGGTRVRLPHTCAETPYNCFNPEMYQMISGYSKVIVPPQEWRDKRIFITFEGAAHQATVYLNGQQIGTHKCGYTAFTIELTDYLIFDQENILAVELDSHETLNIPPFGFVIDYMTYGGIYRDVYIETGDRAVIKDAFVYTPKTDKLGVRVTTDGADDGDIVETAVSDSSGQVIHKFYSEISRNMTEIREHVTGVTEWTLSNPELYTITITLRHLRDDSIDKKCIRTGFRTVEFRKDGFYLNNTKTRLRGLNRHQSYPYVGYAMPESVQKADADILKKELGVNAVRTSHYPQSHYFLDRCDELGILVFTEIPGWQHIGDKEWQAEAVQNVRDMVIQYRNHPSIFLWGVRINESVDDDEFYSETNKVAHELDDTRPTSGVRYLEKSSLLEDVYAFNDFSHTGDNKGLKGKKKVTSDMEKGFFVSECNGHMFPTKAFDCEEHRLQQAIRHCNVLESMYESEDIGGLFGWCMTDYNTHKDFGSGDGICYHGVMDMYRNPKMAAAVYASQSSEEPVCEISSSMDIGEHPAGNIGTVYAFTNCDFVRLYKNDVFIKEFYPDRNIYGHMPHPPVIIDDFIGNQLVTEEKMDPKTAATVKECLMAVAKYGQTNLPVKYMLKLLKLMTFKHFTFEEGVRLFGKYIGNWGGQATRYKFEAVKNGRVVKTVEKQPGSSVRLQVIADHTELLEKNSYDAALVRIRAVDEFGNIVPYYNEPVKLTVNGNIEIAGPDVTCLRGGKGGTLIRTTQANGQGELIIEAGGRLQETVKFVIN